MPQSPSRPLAALLTLSCGALGLTQTTFGELLGVSRTTMNRWMGGRTSGLTPSNVATLVRALVPVNVELAREVAAYRRETPESLGLLAPPAPVALEHLIDSVVCAAADAGAQTPAALRPSLRAAFERAKAVGLSLEDLVNGLREPKAKGARASA